MPGLLRCAGAVVVALIAAACAPPAPVTVIETKWIPCPADLPDQTCPPFPEPAGKPLPIAIQDIRLEYERCAVIVSIMQETHADCVRRTEEAE